MTTALQIILAISLIATLAFWALCKVGAEADERDTIDLGDFPSLPPEVCASPWEERGGADFGDPAVLSLSHRDCGL